MGKNQSTQRVYAKFEGEQKPNESQVLKNAVSVIKPTDPQTMLQEFEYFYSQAFL